MIFFTYLILFLNFIKKNLYNENFNKNFNHIFINYLLLIYLKKLFFFFMNSLFKIPTMPILNFSREINDEKCSKKCYFIYLIFIFLLFFLF